MAVVLLRNGFVVVLFSDTLLGIVVFSVRYEWVIFVEIVQRSLLWI